MSTTGLLNICRVCKGRLRKWVLPTIAFVLFGCETAPQMKDIDVPVEGKAVVFGSVEVYEDGEPKTWGMKWTGIEQFSLLILPPGESRAVIYRLAEDGNFTWGLAPGEYTIAGYELAKGTDFQGGRIWARFSVPPDVSSVYIGDLKVSILPGMFAIAIRDNYDAAAESFRTRYPKIVDVPYKGLMEPEGTLGSFEDIKYICSEGWGIECSRKYHGVTPVQPAASVQGFSEASSLTPLFEWKPSLDENIAYDLVIHEAISYSRGGIGTQYLVGGVAIYEEGLRSSTWQPTTPLKPDQKYYWSVRLRRNGIVSSWSKYSYFAFYGVGWSSGYGQWFSFVTPGEAGERID